MNRIKRFVGGLRPYVLTVFFTLFVLGLMFLFIHRIGFINFVSNPSFYDSVTIKQVFEVTKK